MANMVCKLIEVPGGKELELENLTHEGRMQGRFLARKLIEELNDLSNKEDREESEGDPDPVGNNGISCRDGPGHVRADR